MPDRLPIEQLWTVPFDDLIRQIVQESGGTHWSETVKAVMNARAIADASKGGTRATWALVGATWALVIGDLIVRVILRNLDEHGAVDVDAQQAMATGAPRGGRRATFYQFFYRTQPHGPTRGHTN